MQAKLAHEKLNISKAYHPFISGPNGSNAKAISEKTGARIHVPPISVEKDEIVVSGEKDGVLKAVKEITTIYNDKVADDLLYFWCYMKLLCLYFQPIF